MSMSYIHWINHYAVESVVFLATRIRWTVISSVDSVIHPLNNWLQVRGVLYDQDQLLHFRFVQSPLTIHALRKP